MLLAFKHTHLISALDVFFCSPLHLLSACTFWAFFDKPPCPTSLNIVLYPSHWQPPLTFPRQKQQPLFHSDASHPCRTFLLSPQSCPTNPRIPLPLPCKAASPSRWLPSASNFCILVSCFQTLVKFPIGWSVRPLIALSSSVGSCTSQLSLLFLPCPRCSSRRVPVWTLRFLFPLSLLLSLSHALFLLPVNKLLRPPPCSILYLSSELHRVSHINPSVSLSAIYHCRWITLPSCSCWSPGFDNVREMYEDKIYKLSEIV